VTGYAVVRFWLEALRGDCGVPTGSLSAAQWTSLAAAATVASLALSGAPPGAETHLAVTVALALAAPLVAVRRSPALLGPRHVHELARVLPSPRPGRPVVRETSLDVRCSAGADAGLAHYTLSSPRSALAAGEAGALARLILWLRHPNAAGDVVAGAAGTYHVLVGPHPARGMRDDSRCSRCDPIGPHTSQLDRRTTVTAPGGSRQSTIAPTSPRPVHSRQHTCAVMGLP
jgi:hypothetical protein